MITEKNATAINNSGLGVNRYNLVMTPEVFKVFYSSLYEDKELAVLRELVSNGDDGHTKAGLKNTPVVVHLPTKLVPELVIIDQGIGMSMEDIQTTYTTYGKSTKRDSNDEIGGFGYGAKSPFAISQSFTVETTKDGVTTTFVNFIDEDGPNYTVISSIQTDRPSGTTVKVPVADEGLQRRLAAKANEGLFALWETHPDIKNNTTTSSVKYKVINRKSTHLEVELFNGHSLTSHVASGPFIYRIPTNMLDRLGVLDDYKFLTAICAMSGSSNHSSTRVRVLPSFGVGELELSPSRERIEDTKENEQKIVRRIAEIVQSLRVPAFTLEEHIEKAALMVSKYGVSVSDLIGTVQNDYVLAFKNTKELVEEILPAGWEPSLVNIIAVAHQYAFHNVNFHDIANAPRYIQANLVTSKNIAAVRVHTNSSYLAQCVYNLGLILLSASSKQVDVNDAISRIVVRELEIYRRSSRSYFSAREFYDKQTFILVPEKAQPLVSRCLNNVTTGWISPYVIFTDSPADKIAILDKTAKLLGYTFNYVYQDEIKQLNKTIPKTTRAASTTISTNSGPTDRRLARIYSMNSRDHTDVLESGIATVLAAKKTLLLVLDEVTGIDSVLPTRIQQLVTMQEIQILFISAKEYESKKYISKFFEQLPASDVFTMWHIDHNKLTEKVKEYLFKLPNTVIMHEELVAATVVDKTTFKHLYPKTFIKDADFAGFYYCNNRSSFGSYLKDEAAAPLDLRCKYAGYQTLHDVKELMQVTNAKDLAFIKKALSTFATSKLNY
jgi:hypothetical protein